MLWDTSSVSGLTVTTMTVSPTKREPPFGAGTPGGGFLFLRMVNLTFGIPDLSIPDSPQKSSAVQKVYKHSSLGIYCIFLPKFMVYLFCGLARPLTPDQQDGVGEKTAAVAEELVFSNSMPTSWKNGALPRMSSRKKIADYFGITVEELMGTKKSPPGWASSTNRCRKLWRCLTAQRGGNAAALPGKAGVNQPTNGRSVLAGASVRMARTSGTIS